MRAGRFIFSLLALVLCAVLCGCGSSVNVAPMLAEFDTYDADLSQLSVEQGALQILDAGREKRKLAGELAAQGKGDQALPAALRSLADARVALEMQGMQAAKRHAEHCRLAVERARTKWREALFVLEQTENFVGKESGFEERVPEKETQAPVFPGSSLEPDAFPPQSLAEISEQWSAWRDAAKRWGVAAADLESSYEESRALAQADKVEAAVARLHAYRAARAVQALECRVRARVDELACQEAAATTALLGDARAAALNATLDLERGLQGELRRELKQLRVEASTRQDELYEALSRMEGKFASIRRDARGTIVSLADILFDFDKATLRRNVEFSLVKIATILNQFGEMKILIEGHTDSIGTDEYNLGLSQRRAQAVYEFLVSQDVAADRMSYEGYGESRPVADNDSDEGRQKNRRVDLVIQEAP